MKECPNCHELNEDNRVTCVNCQRFLPFNKPQESIIGENTPTIEHCVHTEKINGGKLVLSLLTYLLGTVIILLLTSLIVAIIIKLPILSSIAEFFNSDASSILPIIPYIVSALVPYLISDKINENSERTHKLATFVFGIIVLSIQGLSLIVNVIFGTFTFINIIGIIIGIVFIMNGKAFLT